MRSTGEPVPKRGIDEGTEVAPATATGPCALDTPLPAKPIRVIDAFCYNGELRALLLRLRTLESVVDRFVVFESSVAFSGKQKKYRFPEQIHHVPASTLRKLTYVRSSVDHAPRDTSTKAMWVRDFSQKAALLSVVVESIPGVRDSDYLLFSDCDEIADPRLMQNVIEQRLPGVCFRPHWFHFNFDNYLGLWLHDNVSFGTVETHSALVEKFREDPVSPISYFHHAGMPEVTGGWHVSFFVSPDEVLRKLTEYAHAGDEREQHMLQEVSAGALSIESLMERGGELFSYNGIQSPRPFFSSFPPCVDSGDWTRSNDNIPNTFITIWLAPQSRLHPKVFQNLERLNPDMDHIHYDNAGAEAFLAAEFGKEYLSLYHRLMPNKYKADLLRLCHLWKHGGYYTDVDLEYVRPFNAIIAPEATFYSVLSTHNGHLFQALLFAAPGSPIIKYALGEMMSTDVRFLEERAEPWMSHPTAGAYRAVQSVLGPGPVEAGVHRVGGHTVHIDQELLCVGDACRFSPDRKGQHHVVGRNGRVAWSRYPDFTEHGWLPGWRMLARKLSRMVSAFQLRIPKVCNHRTHLPASKLSQPINSVNADNSSMPSP